MPAFGDRVSQAEESLRDRYLGPRVLLVIPYLRLVRERVLEDTGNGTGGP